MGDFPVPSEDLLLGAHETDKGRVRFATYAPGKTSMHVIGRFNGWQRDADAMQAGDDGVWTLEKSLPPGIHPYQFVADGQIVISDPYARGIRFADKDEPATSLIAVGREPFTWRHADWPRPPFHDLIIYELSVADFSPSGDLRGVIDKLDYLQDLGINAIELMPIFGFASQTGWGYDPTHFFAVHPAYGTDDDLRELVDQCHGRGIAVLLDAVFAHTGFTHPFTRLYDLKDSPWYSHALTKNEQLFGLPTLDYGRPGARRFAADVIAYWLSEFQVDGYRLDYLSLIGVCGREGIDHLGETARAVRQEAYLIGELLPEDPQQINSSPLSGTWHLRIERMLRAVLLGKQVDDHDPAAFGRCVDVLDPQKQGYDHATRMVNYAESHDEVRLVWELLQNGDDEETARRKAALASSIVMTMPGEPMLYAGQEWGERTELVKGRNPLQWEELDSDAGRGMFEHHQRLCRLRHEHAALRSGHYRLMQIDEDGRTFAFHRWHDGGDEVVVAINLSDQERAMEIEMPRPGSWKEVQADHSFDIGEDLGLGWTVSPWSAVFIVRD